MAAALAVSTAGCRGDTVWNALLGDWFAAGNWTNGIPNSGSAAIINSGLVSVSANASNANTSQLILGGTNTGKIAGLGMTNNELNAYGAIIGRDAGASGLLTLGSNSVFDVEFLNDLIIGDQGTGVMSASLGASIYTTAGVSLGRSAGGAGTLSLNASRMDAVNDLGYFDIGNGGSGTLEILNGGALIVYTMPTVLGRSGGTGSVSVSGPDSLLRVLSNLAVASDSTVTVNNGGFINVGGQIEVGSGDFTFGPAGRIFGSTWTLASDSQLTFSLAGAGSEQFGRLQGGTLFLDGTLRIALDAGFTPDAGVTFPLLNWANTPAGQFDTIELPSLDDGLFWDTSALYLNGTLQVVPEPASGACLFAGTVAWALLRLRRRLVA